MSDPGTPPAEPSLGQRVGRILIGPDELVQDVVSRYLQEGGRFVEGARRGEGGLQQDEYLTREERSNP